MLSIYLIEVFYLIHGAIIHPLMVLFYTEENLQGKFYTKKSAKIATMFAHKSKKTMKKDNFDIRFIYLGRVFGGILPFYECFEACVLFFPSGYFATKK